MSDFFAAPALPATTRPWRQLQLFPTLLRNYLEGDDRLAPFYDFSPDRNGLLAAAEARTGYPVDRLLLQERLRAQYLEMDPDFERRASAQAVLKHLEALGSDDCLTVTTGHQLQLFGGVHFFWYKIMDTILLARRLEHMRGGKPVVPVFWMGAEDHDFEEIRRIRVGEETWEWTSEQFHGQSVGRLDPTELLPLIHRLRQRLAITQHGEYLSDWLEAAHRSHQRYAQTYRQMIHQMLGATGLLILDSDDASLKTAGRKLFTTDVLDQNIGRAVMTQSSAMEEAGFATQVTPYSVNQFMHTAHGRHRIEAQSGYYTLKDRPGQTWSTAEMESLIERHPEYLSPNVITRPIFQEQLLPNVAYFGGPSEVGYWLQLRAGFEAAEAFFPVVLPRNSAFWISGTVRRKMQQLDLDPQDFFQKIDVLKARYIEDRPEVKLFYHQWQETQACTHKLHTESERLPEELRKVAASEVQAARHRLDAAARRLRRRARQDHSVALNRLDQAYEALFPGGAPQERVESFMSYYREMDDQYFQTLLQHFDPLDRSVYFFDC